MGGWEKQVYMRSSSCGATWFCYTLSGPCGASALSRDLLAHSSHWQTLGSTSRFSSKTLPADCGNSRALGRYSKHQVRLGLAFRSPSELLASWTTHAWRFWENLVRWNEQSNGSHFKAMIIRKLNLRRAFSDQILNFRGHRIGGCTSQLLDPLYWWGNHKLLAMTIRSDVLVRTQRTITHTTKWSPKYQVNLKLLFLFEVSCLSIWKPFCIKLTFLGDQMSSQNVFRSNC